MIEELKTFISVVELNNFTKAAHHLNLSQPSVSNHIKSLENYFNVTIIDRSIKQKKIYITESGNILFKRAKEIIQILDLTKGELLNNSDDIIGNIKLGASLTIGEYILPKFLSYFYNKYPEIKVEVLIENTNSIYNKLSNIELDIGFVEGTYSASNIEQNFIFEDKMVLAFPYDEFINPSTISIDNFSSYNWIVREKGSGTREMVDIFLNNNKITPKNLFVFGSNYAVKEAVKNNLGITLMSNLIAHDACNNKEISILPIKDNLAHNFSYILPKNITLQKATQVFISELKEYLINKNI